MNSFVKIWYVGQVVRIEGGLIISGRGGEKGRLIINMTVILLPTSCRKRGSP